MTAKIIDGTRDCALGPRRDPGRARSLAAAHGIQPGLAVVMVGENPASKVYVRNKVRACADVGIASEVLRFRRLSPRPKSSTASGG